MPGGGQKGGAKPGGGGGPPDQGGQPGPNGPDAKQGSTGRGEKKPAPPDAKATKGLPADIEQAERIARELLDKVQSGKVSLRDLEALGLSVSDLKSFLRDVERARSSSQASKGGPSTAPPSFADFLKEMDGTQKRGEKTARDGGKAGSSEGTGKGAIRGVTEDMKVSVDLEYQDVLEEYYRSLAKPK